MSEKFLQEQKEKERNLEEAEKNPEKIEPETRKDPTERISEIDSDIAKRQENIVDTENKLDAVRSALSLPEMPEMPPSIVASQSQIEKLNKEKGELEGNKEQPLMSQEKNLEEMKLLESNLRTSLMEIRNQAKDMLDALYERQGARFTPIQSEENFQQIASEIKNLELLEISPIDPQKISVIAERVNKLARLFDDIQMRSGEGAKDSAANLEKLLYGSKSFSISVDEKGRRLPVEMEDKKMEESVKSLRNSFHLLSEKSGKLPALAGRMREDLSRYTR